MAASVSSMLAPLRLPSVFRSLAQLCNSTVAQERGYAAVTELLMVPAYKGRAVEVKKGQLIKVVNTYGQQVVDFWAFCTETKKGDLLLESMSMHHSHDNINGLIPKVGDVMVTSRRRPILSLLEDTGPGIHDTSVAACDHFLYENMLGIKPEDAHDSCTNNLHQSLKALGYKLTDYPEHFLTPSPFNLWMNVPFQASKDGGKLEQWWAPPHPDQKPGDHVVFRAELDVVCVMSACPSDDICGINGPKGTQPVHYQVLDGK